MKDFQLVPLFAGQPFEAFIGDLVSAEIKILEIRPVELADLENTFITDVTETKEELFQL